MPHSQPVFLVERESRPRCLQSAADESSEEPSLKLASLGNLVHVSLRIHVRPNRDRGPVACVASVLCVPSLGGDTTARSLLAHICTPLRFWVFTTWSKKATVLKCFDSGPLGICPFP